MNVKSKKFFFIFLSIFLGFFSPIRFVQAGWVLDLITGIATTPFFWIFWAVAQIAKYLTELMGSILNWVLGPNFIRWSYTNPANNEVIKIGLGVTQGFVNMLLVLVLVYIAIATILRLAGYETKKLLVTFIIVALLVNFAPVLCGLIVDAANIIMNFFVQDLKADVISKTMGAKITEIYSFSWSEGAQQSISRLFQLMIFSGILFTLSFILFVFILIFILRYLVIWLLVILSPLAFVAYILPATRKYFEQWWKQFLAWTFIGVTCGFFLYLSILMLNRVPTSITAPTTGQGSLLDAILPYFVAVIFLGVGIVFGLQTSAMGATGIMDFAKSKGKTGAKWAVKRIPESTMAATAGAIRGVGGGAKEGWREGRPFGRIIGTGAALGGALRGGFKGATSYEGREKGREVMGRMLEKAHLVKPGAYETARRKRWKIEEETKRLDVLPTDRVREIAHRTPIRPADRRGAIAAFEVLAKRSALKDEEKGILPKMQSFGADIKQTLKARPDWASEVGKKTSEVVAGTNPRDFTKNTQAEALKNINVLISLDIPKIQNIGAHGSTEQKKALRELAYSGTIPGTDLSKLADKLIAENNIKEFDRIRDLLTEILDNPNFRH